MRLACEGTTASIASPLLGKDREGMNVTATAAVGVARGVEEGCRRGHVQPMIAWDVVTPCTAGEACIPVAGAPLGA